MNSKPTNPKDIIGVMKVPLHLMSPFAEALISVALYLGATKYGAANYRAGGVRYSVYLAALRRHVAKFTEGEEYDTDGTPHLANALACLLIIAEAYYLGCLVDDRPPSAVPALLALYEEIEKEIMPKIKEKYGHMEPKHWTIADTEECARGWNRE